MNTRNTLHAALIAATILSGCSQNGSAQKGSAETPPGITYEAHVSAGGSVPPGAKLANPHKGDAASAQTGGSLFASMNCDGCHGGGAVGWVGPSLVDGRWRYGGDEGEIFQSIFYGRPKGMPAYGGALGVDGVWMIVTYLQSQPVPSVVPTTSYEDMDKAPAPAAAAPEAASAPQAAAAAPSGPAALLKTYGCVACHSVDAKIVGPALKDVAAKYRGQADAQKRLEAKVKAGGSGVWGEIPMPPNTAVTDSDLHEMVNWILTSPELKK